MKEKLFKIRPLKWQKDEYHEDSYVTYVLFGRYEIFKIHGVWNWELMYVEEGGLGEGKSLEDCKKKVWKDWLFRIKSALIKVKTKQ